ncbi:MAG: SDR family oxidoreductase [Actinomycetota bacterium]
MSAALERRRVVVVGSSAGIGRSFAVRAVREGADVVLGARRSDVLDAVVAEAGGGHAAVVDVCDGDSRERFVAEARQRLGEIDLLLCTAGYAELRTLADTDEETWARTIATNVVGLNRLLALAVPALSPVGIVSVLSSESTSRPRKWLMSYAASKAALEASLTGWRIEQPGVRISCVIVGATFPTEFGAKFDAEALGPALEAWTRQGLLPQEFMAPDDVAACLVDIYGSALRHPGVCIDEVVLRSPSPPLAAP